MKLLKLTLLPLAWLYGLLIIARNLLYDAGILRSASVGVPVISVGNLTAGGSGKTPIVEHIVSLLLADGVKVGVVSRGYRRVTKGTVTVSDGRKVLATAASGGDEPLQIARKFPPACVVVDEDRARGARCAIREYGAEVVILDDGFQHRALKRDLDLVVVDAEHPPQHTWMLPAGLRREPVSGLKRAGAVVVSHWSEEGGPHVSRFVRSITGVEQFRAGFSVKSLVRLSDGTRRPLEDARGISCVAFCGIAKPWRFSRTLEEIGLTVKTFRHFADHHYYSGEELEHLEHAFVEGGAEFLITTEKDGMRLLGGAKDFLDRCPVYYVELVAHISDGGEFSKLIFGIARTYARRGN